METKLPAQIKAAKNEGTAEAISKLSSITLNVGGLTETEPLSKKRIPLLSTVIDDFIKRYDPNNRAMLTKLKTTLPLFVELVGDKPINNFLQADITNYLDLAQKLPTRRDKAEFKGLTLLEIINANKGEPISKKTFTGTHVVCVSVFLKWAAIHYGDQGFKRLSVEAARYDGERHASPHLTNKGQ